MNYIIIGSGNGLSPIQRQAIIQNNAVSLSVGILGSIFYWHFNQKSNIIMDKNAYESVVCKMAAILSRPHCVRPVKYSAYLCLIVIFSKRYVHCVILTMAELH